MEYNHPVQIIWHTKNQHALLLTSTLIQQNMVQVSDNQMINFIYVIEHISTLLPTI